MKLPFTDSFLWSVYNVIEGVDRVYDFFAPRTMRQALCPDLFQFEKEYKRRKAKRSFGQFISYLKNKGYIQITNLKHVNGVTLTPKGAEKVLRIRLKIGKMRKRADGKLEMIIFDIPEKKKKLRELLRAALAFLGYERLQDSVWVTPYDVERETERMIEEYALDPYVKIFIIEQI